MIKKTITYEDYNGVKHTEDFYFNLSKAEVARLEMSKSNGYENFLTNVASREDVTTMYSEFEKMILSAYGEKSDDGKRFIKSDELSKAFSQTEAYSELIVELMQSRDEAEKFFTGVLSIQLNDHKTAEAIKEARAKMEGPSSAHLIGGIGK